MDTNVETIDILPRLAVALGVRLPWTTDGANVLDPAWRGRPAKTMLVAGGGTRRMAGPADLRGAVMERVRHKLALFEAGDPLHAPAAGFHGLERTEDRAFRWTTGEARINCGTQAIPTRRYGTTGGKGCIGLYGRWTEWREEGPHLAECARRSGGREAPRQHPWAAATTESPRGGRSRPDWPSDRIGELKRGP